MSNNPNKVFQPPFTYDAMGQMIWAGNSMVLNVRGWGALTGKGQCGCGLSEEDALARQDAFGERVAKAMNAEWAKGGPAADVCQWTLDNSDQGLWAGTCGAEWIFMDDGPTENEVAFCPKCGRRVNINDQPEGDE